MKTQYKSLRINYEAKVELELDTICEDLKITVEDIRAITVNYNVLTIKTFDDKTLIYEFDSILFSEDIETASPYSMMLMKDKSYEYIHGNDTITLHKF
tara:strand:+ start:507 stop:800 length:294 start_codon:yes stop_codon:yes gene_type:complete